MAIVACLALVWLIAFSPQIQKYPALRGTLYAANGILVLLFVLLLLYKLSFGQKWDFALNLRVPNLIQACVQSSIYVFMSQFSPGVGNYAPLIFYQIFFAFVFDFLLSLLVYKNYRFGFSILPIVLSINLFIWFRPQYFYLQLAMVALAIYSKHIIVRNIAGRQSHVFNPSGIAMALGAVFILFSGSIRQYVFIDEIIVSYNSSRPYIFLFILFVGSISQWVGRIVLISLGAVVTLFSLSSLCELITGLPAINHWIDPSVMVGVTLLVTDPATSPKKNWGKFLFGCCYGLGILFGYGVLSRFQLPGYYAKILALPFLNLLAPFIDRIKFPFVPSTRAQRFYHPGVQGLLYVAVFLALLPTVHGPRQKSYLGALGGAAWAAKHGR